MLARLRSLRVEDPDEQRGVFGLVRGEGARPDLARVAPEPEAGRGGPRGHLARAPLAVLPLPDDLEARFLWAEEGGASVEGGGGDLRNSEKKLEMQVF